MSAQITIQCDYSISSSTTITLPGNATWDDVGDWYVKWGTFHYALKDDPEDAPMRSLELDDVSLDSLDTKRPSGTQVFDADNNEVASK